MGFYLIFFHAKGAEVFELLLIYFEGAKVFCLEKDGGFGEKRNSRYLKL